MLVALGAIRVALDGRARPNRVRTVGEAACRARGARVSMNSGVEGSTASAAGAGSPIGCRDPPAGSEWSVSPSTWSHEEPDRTRNALRQSRGLGDLGDLSVPSRKKREHM